MKTPPPPPPPEDRQYEKPGCVECEFIFVLMTVIYLGFIWFWLDRVLW